MGRVEDMRGELAGDSPRWGTLPACGKRATCASDVAVAIGAPFDEKKPDQISAAAVAVVVARDHHASDVGSPDVWLAAMRRASGPGADALRLAVALEMSLTVSKDARALVTDEDGQSFVLHVAAAVPGACKTYDMLGGGANPDTMVPQDSPDHSACVQSDLARKDGPGSSYGQGLFRAAAGALALWKAALSALHEGSGQMQGTYKAALDRRLVVLDAETGKITPKVVAAPGGNMWNHLAQGHNTPLVQLDAGGREPQ
jgi:hypothetical protein